MISNRSGLGALHLGRGVRVGGVTESRAEKSGPKNPEESGKIRKNPKESGRIRKNPVTPSGSGKIRKNPEESGRIRKNPEESGGTRKNPQQSGNIRNRGGGGKTKRGVKHPPDRTVEKKISNQQQLKEANFPIP